MIFIDADFFIGLYYLEDIHHKTCLSLIEKIEEELITSHDVVDEVVTKLTYFGKKETALIFIKDLKNNNIPIIYANTKLFSKAIKIFSLQKTKHTSLTDCINMVIASEKNIKLFLSFDKIYEKNGFKLVK